MESPAGINLTMFDNQNIITILVLKSGMISTDETGLVRLARPPDLCYRWQ